MPTIHDSYINALLADATYALDERAVGEVEGVVLNNFIKDRMTTVLADYISSNFKVVTHIETDDNFGSGFDATVWE